MRDMKTTRMKRRMKMSSLEAFLKPTHTSETLEVVVSERFLDSEGKPVPFILKSISQEVINELAKRSTKEIKVGGRKIQEIDKVEHLNRCLVETCIQPDFKSRELCLAYGTETPVCLPQRMLLVKEYEKLAKAFIRLHGLDDDDAGEEAIGKITKN